MINIFEVIFLKLLVLAYIERYYINIADGINAIEAKRLIVVVKEEEFVFFQIDEFSCERLDLYKWRSCH